MSHGSASCVCRGGSRLGVGRQSGVVPLGISNARQPQSRAGLPCVEVRYHTLVARRAGLYLRISKDPSGDRLAVERQRTDGEAMIARRGWEHVDTYEDNDLSAKGRRQRPEFQRLMRDIRDGRIDTPVADRWDRLSRNRRDDLTIVETCQPRDALLAFMRGSDIDLSTASGRLTADIMSAVARNEIEVKSERQIRQAAQQAERGLPGAIGQRAFGYLPDGMHLDPVEARILQQMYDRWLTGQGTGSLAAWLNGMGLATPRGNRWTHQNVREVLANPRNAGLRGMRDVVNPKTGTRAQWHRIIGPAVWPGAVSEQTWRAAMERIHDPHRPGQHVGMNGQRHLLSGLALCGATEDGHRPDVHDPGFTSQVCGLALTTGGRNRDRLLRCPSLKHVSRRADLIEDFVEEAIIEYFRRPDTPDLDDEPGAGAFDIESIRSESIELRARLDGLARDYADGILDRTGVKTAGDRIRGRLAELDRQIAAAGQVDVTAGLRAAADPEPIWDELPLATRREVVRRVVTVHVLRGYPGRPGGLRFHPETVRLQWHI